MHASCMQAYLPNEWASDDSYIACKTSNFNCFCLDQRLTGKREQAPCCCIACMYVSKRPPTDDAPYDVKFWLGPVAEI